MATGNDDLGPAIEALPWQTVQQNMNEIGEPTVKRLEFRIKPEPVFGLSRHGWNVFAELRLLSARGPSGGHFSSGLTTQCRRSGKGIGKPVY
ncbi:hypothetical protein NKJ40_03925 [Mesorhizobium sp. M0119]|uniref:hypothetical protein n=1 Tax=unclassified Mesorhizobium TaxID=325217 RepID=UPI00333B7FE5